MTSRRTGPRAPAVAGSFYPRSAETLSRTVASLLAAARTEQRQRCRGIIAPHAGYLYSGAVAAGAFAAVRRLVGRIERAIVIGPAHFVPFRGVAAPSHAAFTTPLGEVPVDVALVEALRDETLITVNDETPRAGSCDRGGVAVSAGHLRQSADCPAAVRLDIG